MSRDIHGIVSRMLKRDDYYSFLRRKWLCVASAKSGFQSKQHQTPAKYWDFDSRIPGLMLSTETWIVSARLGKYMNTQRCCLFTLGINLLLGSPWFSIH